MEGTLNPGELEIWVKFWTWMWNQAKTQWSRPRNCCVRHFASDTSMPTELMNEVLELIATKHTYEEIGSMKWCRRENWDVRIFKNQNMQNNEAWREVEDALIEHQKSRDNWAEIVKLNATFNSRKGIDIIPESDYETSCTVVQHLVQEGII